MKTRLAMSSMISYFNDRILSPEMMRAMIILYIGPHNRPDFSTDYLLSPLLAPEQLLAEFPKTYFLTGERDPLVDDTVIFAGRVRQAKYAKWLERKELGLSSGREAREFVEMEHVEVTLIPGISHGFLQFVSVFPEGWRYIFRCARWMREIFDRVDAEEQDRLDRENGHAVSGSVESMNGIVKGGRHHRRTRTESSGDEDRPLEMGMSVLRKNGSQGNTPPATDDNGPGAKGRREKTPTLSDRRRANRRPDVSRQKSLVSLASSDDLLGRRMKGLTGVLGGENHIPPTP
ncbi:hypothetical protein LTS18_012660 [Coniosporium uncinatum]|uniref:Uncharacterized protein n=1 Tax=Coniosporium uncinatum TaxID=93489 RepID=A0ACC3DJA1_9PEZI|nr:hypothetical protein LTS18_012660 [Coniosporium uncinatum]